MTKRTPPEHVTKQPMANQFKLMEFVRDNFAKEAKSDIAFSVLASEKLGFRVTFANVAGARQAFGIPSTKDVTKKPATRLSAIEARLEVLEKFMKEFK